jgi:hypothetical protein
MIDILQRLQEDKDFDKYYSMSNEETEKYFKEILDFANSNKNEFVKFCNDVQLIRHNCLDIIYDALLKDIENWGGFLAEEHHRVFQKAKISEDPYDATYCLDSITCMENRNKAVVDKIIEILSKELNNPIDALKHRAISLLTDWIDETNQGKHKEVIRKMKEKIQDENWKIRWIAHQSLKGKYGLSEHELKIPISDKVKNKLFFIFGNPTNLSNDSEAIKGDEEESKFKLDISSIGLTLFAVYLFYSVFPYKESTNFEEFLVNRKKILGALAGIFFLLFAFPILKKRTVRIAAILTAIGTFIIIALQNSKII